MMQRSAHPLRSGAMACTSCHNPHGSAGEASLVKTTINETCATCHAEKRGPFLWEHAPVREDCSTCHTPHGSNNVSLLKMPTARLCQSCHLLGHHQTVSIQQGTVWVQNRACVNCHQQIHGSNHPSGAIFQR
jgi:DmsE family decaheme c-type cytochrome